MIEIIVTVILEVAKCLAPATERRFSYLRKHNYNSNFGNLKKQFGELKGESTIIQHKVDDAKRQGEQIEESVENWLIKASTIINEAEKFLEDVTERNERCFKGLFPNLKTRYQLSKKAATDAKAIVDLLDEARRLHSISYRVIPEDIQLTSVKDYETFESRMSILQDILSAFSNPNISMIGIYGMGGIGKTTLAKEVARQAQRNKLFDQVVFADVSHSPDIKKIQGEIADKLGLSFSEESESGRAGKLCQRLKIEEKILVILDNIWTSLDLMAVGIPCGDHHRGCKVLLTARSEDVLLSKMDSQKNFLVSVLNEEEAWHLFKKVAGDYVEGSLELKSLATAVAKKCAGLPISIVTVARALRNKRLFEWQDALQQLEAPSSTKFKDVQSTAYSAIKLSYEKLQDEDAKNIFLLIAYTYITSIDDLVYYGQGLGFFQGINKMEKVQTRVRALVQRLRASCMLLGDEDGEDFFMHDVVRDCAISIASADHNVFTTRNARTDQWEWKDENALKTYSSVILYDVNITELPEVLQCPKLKLFSIRAKYSFLKFPEEFFATMVELKVLEFTNMDLSSLPSSLGLLTNLRTLRLHQCTLLDDVAVIGDLKRLEILSFQGSKIEQLPVEVGQLTQLRTLDLRGCFPLFRVPPHIISRLSHLEELYIGEFAAWELVGLDEMERNASLSELKYLSHLTCLEICIGDVQHLPRDLFFNKLERYNISVGDYFYGDKSLVRTCKKLRVTNYTNSICFMDRLIMQLKGIEDLCLTGQENMKNVLYELDKEGFPQLKRLQLRRNPNLLCIVDMMDCETRNAFPLLESLYLEDLANLQKICPGQLAPESFGKLKTIKVEECNDLKNLFSFFMAQGLSELQTIEVRNSWNVEVIFDIGTEDEFSNIREAIDNIELSKLRSLTLASLPRLTSFCSLVQTTSASHHRLEEWTTDRRSLINEKVAIPNLETLELYEINVQKIWQNQFVAISSGIQNLTRLIVSGCHHLSCLFSSSIVGFFVQLRHLEICKCSLLQVIVAVDEGLGEEERKDAILFPKLNFLKVEGLEKLTRFCTGYYIEFPSLNQLEITRCPELKEFMAKSISTDLASGVSTAEIPSFFNEKVAFPCLKEIVISHLHNSKMLWHHQPAADSFCKLKSMKVYNCDKLRSLFPRNVYRKFLKLESLIVGFCGSLDVIFDMVGINFEETQNAAAQLSVLQIDGLPELKHVWNGDPQDVLSFKKLNMVTIYNCARLKNVFPASVAGSLWQLERLSVDRCGVEEVVFVDEEGAIGKRRFVFPKVISLALEDLPKLTTFFSGAQYSTEWPALKKLGSGCDIVKILSPEFHSFQLQESTHGAQLDIPAQPPDFLLGKVFPNLEELTSRGKGVETMWKFPNEILCKLKYLDIVFDYSTVISSLDFLGKCHNMKRLKITADSVLASNNDKVEDGMLAWIRNVNKCYHLKHIFKQEFNMYNLIDLVVDECQSFISLVASSTSFQNLTTLQVCNCKRLKNLVTSSTSFQNLTTLKVCDCKALKNLVTSSTAMSLVRLRIMTISRCEMVQEIVAYDEGDEAKAEIIFSELKKLELSYLESLTSFCSGNYTFKFPSLEHLLVDECPKMKIFYRGELSTPKLHKVKHGMWGYKELWNGDLNTTIRQLHDEMGKNEQESKDEERSER